MSSFLKQLFMRNYDKYDDTKMVIKTWPNRDVVIPVENYIRVEFIKGDVTRDVVIPEKLIKYLLLESLSE